MVLGRLEALWRGKWIENWIIDWVSRWAGVPLSALAGVAQCCCPLLPPLECSGVLVGRLCGSAEVLGGFWVSVLCSRQPRFRFSLVMTRNDDHLQDAVPTQKLEWVTPKISLMVAGDSAGKR